MLQFSCSFLEGVAEYVEPGLPFISLSKGLELNTLRMMSQIIPQTLKNSRQPYVALSGPSFALELMNKLPTAMVIASKDKKLAKAVQQLLASKNLRISTTSDVTGVEIAGALKNVLAIAAGIVEGLDLGNNSMAALVAQGCSEIRWYQQRCVWIRTCIVMDWSKRVNFYFLSNIFKFFIKTVMVTKIFYLKLIRFFEYIIKRVKYTDGPCG
ncbi:putative glycerol-3-phosphate dehydrogenase (NAD(+)) [Helianthus debilis subsp. tardiflorus]